MSFSKLKDTSTNGFIFCDKDCSLGLAVVGQILQCMNALWRVATALPYTYYIKWLELKIIRIGRNIILVDWLIDRLIYLFNTTYG